MYSPYQPQQQQYAQQSSFLASPSAPTTSNVSVSSSSIGGGLTWNGSAWVSTPAPLAVAAPAVTDWGCNRSQVIPPSPIATFTDYYHKWMEKHVEQEQLLHSLAPTSADRPAVQRQLEWYKYYADQSSRAAHYFYSHGETNVTSAPFDLPPEPPQYQEQLLKQQQILQQQQTTGPRLISSSNSVVTATSKSVDSSSAVHLTSCYNSLFNITLTKPPPDSLKRYVDRCLSQYDAGDLEAKVKVMNTVEDIMQSALKNGTLHYIDWDTVPLVSFDFSEENSNKKRRLKKTTPASGYQTVSTNAAETVNTTHSSTSSSTTFFAGNKKSSYHPTTDSDSATASIHLKTFTPAAELSSSRRVDDYSTYNNTSRNNSNKRQHNSNSNNQTNSTKGTSRSAGGSHLSRGGGEDSDGAAASALAAAERIKRFIAPSSSSSLVHHQYHPRIQSGLSSQPSCLGGNKSWDRYMGKATIGGGADLLEGDYEKMKVKGTNKVLEKHYLRLTGPPKPENVRPQHILKEHLQNLKEMRRASQQNEDDHEGSTRDYLWFCSQLKSIRQDLTVQHLVEKSAFAVDVYETHARIALEEGDLNEFNQCQTQLKELYASFVHESDAALKNQAEFVAYRVLYYVLLMSGNSDSDGASSSDLFKIMSSQHKAQAIRHALEVREAVADGNYHSFFELRKNVPHLGCGIFMDLLLPHVRFQALSIMSRAYRPVLRVSFVLQELGFLIDSDNNDSQKQFGVQWLVSCGCVLSEDQSVWKTQDSVVTESTLDNK